MIAAREVAEMREFCAVRKAAGLSRDAIVADFLFHDTHALYAAHGVPLTDVACATLVRDLLIRCPLPQ